MKIRLIFISCLLSSFYLNAQTDLDSLYTIWLDESRPDSIRVNAYKDYILDGIYGNKPDSAFVLAEALISFGNKKGYRKANSIAFNIQGNILMDQGNYAEALDYHQRGLKIDQELGDKKGISGALNNIGFIYELQSNYPEALNCYQRSLKIAEELGDRGLIAVNLGNIGIVYDSQGNYLKALDFYKRSLKIDEELGDKRGIAFGLGNIGIVYASQGNHPQALDYYQRSLKILEELGNNREIASLLNNIGIIISQQGNYEEALDYYHRGLKIMEELGGKGVVSNFYNNIGSAYEKQGNYQEALDYFHRCLKIREELGDKRGIASTLNNIGYVYKIQGETKKAFDCYQRSLIINKDIGEKFGVATSHGFIGLYYYDQGKYIAAIEECQKSLSLSEEIGEIFAKKEACLCLYNAFKAIGNSQQALKYHEQLTALNDSLFNEANTKKLTQLEMQYAFDKQEAAAKLEQEKKDAIAAQELKQRKLERNGFILGFGVVLLFAGVFFRQRNRIGKEKERSDELLLNILPEEVAEELKTKGHSDAQLIDHVTVLFTDFKDFTKLSEQLSPNELVADLHACFSEFDRICEKYGIEKIKTIGDAYMAAGGLPFPNKTHAKDVVNATLEMVDVVEKIKVEKAASNQAFFEVRIGVHTGPVVAGIVGVRKFQYDIWGDTVNTASRIETNGKAGRVNISQVTYEILKDDPDFTFENRGKISAKGKGEMDMWFVGKNEVV